MAAVLFYRLTRSTVDETARTLLERALQKGWRVTVRSPDAARLDQLDSALWLGPEDAFIPHGRAGGPHDAHQPILLTERDTNANGATAVVLLDGAPVQLDEARGLERVWVLFDAALPDQLDQARAQWRRVTDAGLAAQFWAEEDGRWTLKEDRAEAAPQL